MTDSVTRPGDGDPLAVVEAVPHPVRQRDALTLLELYGSVTGEPPVLWGPSIIGFGAYHYQYASGRTGDAPAAGFSPRKAASTLYLPDGFSGREDLLSRLGPHRTSVSCLYVTDLARVDLDVLAELLGSSYEAVSAPGFGDQRA